MSKALTLKFHNTYAELPESFYSSTVPEQVANPSLVKMNPSLSADLGFSPDDYSDDYLAEVFSGNKLLEGSEPLAQAYAGHQFGGLSPQLGDGRACLLGEVKTSTGQFIDLQLKGSGRTAFSRRGDGKATLYSVLREYLISEAMHALGIPTTRSLAVVADFFGTIRRSRCFARQLRLNHSIGNRVVCNFMGYCPQYIGKISCCSALLIWLDKRFRHC